MLDTTFNAGASSAVTALALQEDGEIIAAGTFTTLNDQSRSRIARISNTAPATQHLSRSGSTITWTRAGTGPEVWRTTFEHSLAGGTWTLLGAGTRIPGGWELTDASLPSQGTLRARGYAVAGYHSASSGLIEAILPLQPVLQLAERSDETSMVLNWTGGQGPYQVQQSTNLKQPESWQNLGAPTQSNSISIPVAPAICSFAFVDNDDASSFDPPHHLI